MTSGEVAGATASAPAAGAAATRVFEDEGENHLGMEIENGAERQNPNPKGTMTMTTEMTIAEGCDVHIPNSDEVKKWVRGSMHAITRLLVGSKGDPRDAAFNSTAMLIVGCQLPPSGFLWLANVARANQRHVIYPSANPDHKLPEIALAYRRGDRVDVYQNCMLCMMPGDDRVTLVPDSFTYGAFTFAANMKLKRRKAPASFNASMAQMKRAYDRFFDLHIEGMDQDFEPLRIRRRHERWSTQ